MIIGLAFRPELHLGPSGMLCLPNSRRRRTLSSESFLGATSAANDSSNEQLEFQRKKLVFVMAVVAVAVMV